jgi:primosomal protein N' (replication factor Y)
MSSGIASGETTSLFEEPQARFVEVALPVPLRRRFTYRVPDRLSADVVVGCRVAVPFSGRKLAGIVVGEAEGPPSGVRRVHAVAGVLDDEPVFPSELLAFLREAADYYMHPFGEVLRAAAPALSTQALRALRKGGFLEGGEALPGRKVAIRQVLVARLTDAAAHEAGLGHLGKRQSAVVELLRARGEATLDDLRPHVNEPRAALRSLERRGIVVTEEREALSDPFFDVAVAEDEPPPPTEAQARAIGALVGALPRCSEDGERQGVPEGQHQRFLLHGITGSGKTEVYLRVIAEARERGLGALVLVPEIALTPQLVARFRARFGDAIAVLHSALGEKDRDEAWRRLRRGEIRIAVGARSALFAPVPELGIVVVDEEHDPSFKQEEGFRYHARDMALLRAHRAGAICVLGSATPSVESYYLAERGKLGLLSLPARATSHQLPSVEVVDLRRHRSTPSGHPLLSAPLHQAIAACLEAGEQGILFLNRRGFAPSLRCSACGEVVRCPACSVALTEHRRASALRCHYCDFAMPSREQCPSCHAAALERLGLGTEKLEDTLAEVFPSARIARLDRDTATGKTLEGVLDRLRRRELDLLVGTQMVTKGHDLPGVTLVGVILADQSLAFPDFRAAERTFQLLAQVAGRAGRGERPGRVLLQTFQPDHPAVMAAASHDFDRFARRELTDRRELGYAPYARLVAVRVDAGDEAKAAAVAGNLGRVARGCPDVRSGRVQVLGPAPAPIARIRGRYRYRLLLRGPERARVRAVAAELAARIDEGVAPARAHVDVDPVSML